MHAKTCGPSDGLQHCEGLVGFADSRVYLPYTVTICGDLAAQIDKLVHFLQRLVVDGDWVAHSGVLPHDLSLSNVDPETYGAC